MNQWTALPVSIIRLTVNKNLSGLHPIEALMFFINEMSFMKSGKSLARDLSQVLKLSVLAWTVAPILALSTQVGCLKERFLSRCEDPMS
jgi:hypothetical protein